MEPVIRSRAGLVLPFAVIAAIAIGVFRMVIEPGWGLLPLLAVGPAVAAAVGGPLYTLASGTAALAVGLLFAGGMPPAATHRMAEVTFLAVAGVTAAGALASLARRCRDRELAQARLVAEAAQKVLLRPVPRQAGPVRLAAQYLSACSGARVGGDLYEVATTADCVRLIVGDAEGKGLPAVQSAAAVLGVFREAAHEEDSLGAIVSRIETSLGRQLSDEQFVTAILAETSADGTKIELLGCGHPPPLLLNQAGPQFIDVDEGSLPLGLGQFANMPRIPVTIPFEPGNALLFYTDGASEARNKSGAFFSLADSAAVRAAPDPATLPDRLSDEVVKYVGHAPDDDMALLVIYRDSALARSETGDSMTDRNRPNPGPGPIPWPGHPGSAIGGPFASSPTDPFSVAINSGVVEVLNAEGSSDSPASGGHRSRQLEELEAMLHVMCRERFANPRSPRTAAVAGFGGGVAGLGRRVLSWRVAGCPDLAVGLARQARQQRGGRLARGQERALLVAVDEPLVQGGADLHGVLVADPGLHRGVD
jgi:serine phosphatase RsbU (regulator of sigma subunit)